MFVKNAHIGKVFVTPHAQERWQERGHDEPMASVLERAHPFGGQFNGAVMLLDGEVVFTVAGSERGNAVTTVLTLDQATANMQMGVPGVAVAHLEVVRAEAAPANDGIKRRQHPLPRVEGESVKIKKMTDGQLQERIESSSGAFREHLQREMSFRSRTRKALNHAETMNLERKALVRLVHEFVPESQLASAWQRLDELRLELAKERLQEQ